MIKLVVFASAILREEWAWLAVILATTYAYLRLVKWLIQEGDRP